MQIAAEYGIIKRINSYDTPKDIYAEGDIVVIKDDWGKHYRGTIIYIDETVLELKKNNTTDNVIKTFEIDKIKEILRA